MSEGNIVTVKGLNKSFGKRKVLEDISFEIHRNEIVGFIGPNGAGKSTTMKCLCNLIFPDSGEITVNGYDIIREREKALESQAALIENPGLYMDMTGYDNIRLIAALRKVPKERLEEMMEFSHLGKALGMKVRKYSLGMKQRLGLAIALLSKPQFLILDEPTNGLDPAGVMELRNTIWELVRNEKISVLFSSHQLGEIEKLADRIICINGGKLMDIPDLTDKRSEYVLQISDSAMAFRLLSGTQKWEIAGSTSSDMIRVRLGKESNLSELLSCLLNNGVLIGDISKAAIDIEQIYTQVYGEKNE